MPKFVVLRYGFLVLLSVLIIGCASSPSTAPVIDKTPVIKKTAEPVPAAKIASPADWRPNSYVVKKGDTLYRIGLEFGFDYKEIAAVNNLVAPYPIKVGQRLLLPTTSASNVAAKPSQDADNGVVITPISVDAPMPSTATKSTVVSSPPLLNQPKATREIYSLEAFNRPAKPADTIIVSKTPAETVNKSSTTEIVTSKASEAKLADDESVQWIWPTKGKVAGLFNEASNKGIDIAGTLSQAIVAAGAGKVIYTGSDLRGYGKLVIVKHNKTFLSVYAHNSKILVKEGQMVSAGQKIAEMGDSDANAVKLHFEIRQQGKSIDPMKYLPKQ